MTAGDWIKRLDLQPHPEGGFYRETYRSNGLIRVEAGQFPEGRCFSTAIYFLLQAGERSMFHRIRSDELWHFYDGSPLTLYLLSSSGLETHVLGRNTSAGESLQIVIPANIWFGAMVHQPGTYCLAGCTVAPGFDFSDFELANRASLLGEFPSAHRLIEQLTPDA